MATADILSLTIVPETVFRRYAAVIPTSHKQPSVEDKNRTIINDCLNKDEVTEFGKIVGSNTKQAPGTRDVSQGLVEEMRRSPKDQRKSDVKHRPNLADENSVGMNRNRIVLLPRISPGKQNNRIIVHNSDISFSDEVQPEDNRARTNYLKLKEEYLKKRREMESEGKAHLQKQKGNLETVTNFVSDIVRYHIPKRSFEISKPRCRYITSSFNIDANDECQPELLVKDVERADDVKGSAGSIADGARDSARSITRESAFGGGSKLERNTRFGSNQKVTAYRPSTSLDGFRRTYQTPVSRSQSTKLSPDVDEARHIWSEIEDIFDKSQKLNRKEKSDIKLNQQASGKLQIPRDENNSIELMACFDRLPVQQQAMSDKQRPSQSNCIATHDQGIQCGVNAVYVCNNSKGGDSSRISLTSPVSMTESAVCTKNGEPLTARSAVCSTAGTCLSDMWPHPTRILLIHPAKGIVDAPFISIPSVGVRPTVVSYGAVTCSLDVAIVLMSFVLLS